MAKVKIPNFKLNNGMEIAALGYGTWLGLNKEMELRIEYAPQLVEAVMYAIDIGYRHFDTAHFYRVEPELGYAVRQKIDEGVVKREDIFITTKVWQHNHRPEDVVASVRASLKRMGLDYVDLVLMHWPMSISQDHVDEKIDYLDTYRGLETVLDKGLTRSIGVSNFNLDQMKRLLANCRVKPVVNEIEVNLTLYQTELINYCQSQDILVVSFASFGSMTNKIKDTAPEPRLDSPTLVSMAKKYGKTVPQVVLRFFYQKGIATIPKSITTSRILENASIFDFEIDTTDIATLEKYNCCYRSDNPIFWQNYTNYPFDIVKDSPPMDIPLSQRKWKNGANLDID